MGMFAATANADYRLSFANQQGPRTVSCVSAYTMHARLPSTQGRRLAACWCITLSSLFPTSLQRGSHMGHYTCRLEGQQSFNTRFQDTIRHLCHHRLRCTCLCQSYNWLPRCGDLLPLSDADNSYEFPQTPTPLPEMHLHHHDILCTA